jgi:hypothetical protein
MTTTSKKPIIRGKMRGLCIVCMCETTKDESLQLHQTKRQAHVLCKDCAGAYIPMKLDDLLARREYSDKPFISCPGTYSGEKRNQCTCKIKITHEKYDCLPKVSDKLTRLQILSCPGAASCPNTKCQNIFISSDLHCTCSSCKTTWCNNCGVTPFHMDMSCAQHKYINDNSEEGQEIKKMVESGVMRLCPKCNHGTLKIDGCNKMHCSQCHEKWCWLCGKGGIDYNHFNDQGVNTCAGKLYLGTEINNDFPQDIDLEFDHGLEAAEIGWEVPEIGWDGNQNVDPRMEAPLQPNPMRAHLNNPPFFRAPPARRAVRPGRNMRPPPLNINGDLNNRARRIEFI